MSAQTLGVAVNNCLESMDYTDTLDIEVKSIEIDLPRKAYPPEDEAKSAMIAAQKRFDSLRNADYITMRNAELDMFGSGKYLLLFPQKLPGGISAQSFRVKYSPLRLETLLL